MHQRARVRETDPHRHERTHGLTNAGSHPRRLWRLFLFARRRSSTSAWSKPDVIPPVPLTFACESSISVWANRFLVVQRPHSTTSLVRGSMAARNAHANTTAALRCATRCRHMANMSTITAASTKRVGTLSHSPPQSPPLSPFLNLTHAHAPPSPRTAPPRPCLPPPRLPVLNNPSLRGARTRPHFISPSCAVPLEQTFDMSPQT
jgi:hypothetical protein